MGRFDIMMDNKIDCETNGPYDKHIDTNEPEHDGYPIEYCSHPKRKSIHRS